uniref:Uncharacterized protein n=1 Tax=Ananas comosus var. bracteatus TaxID=296719 RepID=A0A6V7P4G2_ANACO|nr:unnamed protein product [Ananas comosus var. bracteatus]
MASGVSMVVAVCDEQSNNFWVFIKPLKEDLWLVSAAFFVFTGVIVWSLEHRINDEFGGPPLNQLGTVFLLLALHARLRSQGEYEVFVKEVLLNEGFDESRLVPFMSPQQYEEALLNGSVAAVVHETPY